jgi:hypothetical protein
MGFISNRRYLVVPQDLIISGKMNVELFNCLSKFHMSEGLSFFTSRLGIYNLLGWTRIGVVDTKSNFTGMYLIRFYLKGIGYKFLRSRKPLRWIRVELGYSVSTYIYIPAFVKLFHKRDKLVIISSAKSKLSSFAKQIFHLRPADVYKGKGIRLTNRLYLTFKPGKQR